MRTSSALFILPLLACGATNPLPPLGSAGHQLPFERIALTAVVPGATSFVGLTRDANHGNLHVLVPGVGIVELAQDGTRQNTLAFGERGLVDHGFTDVVSLPDGSFVLSALGEGLRYNPMTATLQSHFCVEPNFNSEIILANHAVTLDETRGRIIAAPTWHSVSDGSFVAGWHSQYRQDDGTPTESTEITASGIVAKGVAFDSRNNQLLVVTGNKLHTFTVAGQVLGTRTLDGVLDASGVAVDADQRILYVLDDGKKELRAFALDGLGF